MSGDSLKMRSKAPRVPLSLGHLRPASRHFLINAAGSTGRCNTLLEFTYGSLKSELPDRSMPRGDLAPALAVDVLQISFDGEIGAEGVGARSLWWRKTEIGDLYEGDASFS